MIPINRNRIPINRNRISTKPQQKLLNRKKKKK
jgi:hypothetical protein